jgi:hypothetical protein
MVKRHPSGTLGTMPRSNLFDDCWQLWKMPYWIQCPVYICIGTVVGVPYFSMGCPKDSLTCASATLKTVRASDSSSFHLRWSRRYNRGYYLKADYSILNGNDTSSATCCRISDVHYFSQSAATLALSDFVVIGKDYEYWVPKSPALGSFTAVGFYYLFGPGHCFKCYTKEEKYYMYLAGSIFLSFAGVACVYGILHYLVVDRWRWISFLKSRSESTTTLLESDTESDSTASPTSYLSIGEKSSHLKKND